MRFEWDEAKNAANTRKHGVDFVTASLIFQHFVLTEHDDLLDYGEEQERSIGLAGSAAILTVIHTDRSGIIRIISARPATKNEKRRYEEALRKSAHA